MGRPDGEMYSNVPVEEGVERARKAASRVIESAGALEEPDQKSIEKINQDIADFFNLSQSLLDSNKDNDVQKGLTKLKIEVDTRLRSTAKRLGLKYVVKKDKSIKILQAFSLIKAPPSTQSVVAQTPVSKPNEGKRTSYTRLVLTDHNFVSQARTEGLNKEDTLNVASDENLHNLIKDKQISFKTALKLLTTLPEKQVRDETVAGTRSIGVNLNAATAEDCVNFSKVDFALAKEIKSVFDVGITSDTGINYFTASDLATASNHADTIRNVISVLPKDGEKRTAFDFHYVVRDVEEIKKIPFGPAREFGFSISLREMYYQREQVIANLNALKNVDRQVIDFFKTHMVRNHLPEIAQDYIPNYEEIVKDYLKHGITALDFNSLKGKRYGFALSLLLTDVNEDKLTHAVDTGFEKKTLGTPISSHLLGELLGDKFDGSKLFGEATLTLMGSTSYERYAGLFYKEEHRLMEDATMEFNTYMQSGELVKAFEILEKTDRVDNDALRWSIAANMQLYGVPLNLLGNGRQGRPLLVFEDADEGIYYTDVSWLPEEKRSKMKPTIAFGGESERVFFVIKEEAGKTKVIEQKGFTLSKENVRTAPININSGDPQNMLAYGAAAVEATSLSKLNVAKASAHKLYTAQDSKLRQVDYGVLIREWNVPYLPFVRSINVNKEIADRIASYMGVSKAEYYENMGRTLGSQLKLMHRDLKYNIMKLGSEQKEHYEEGEQYVSGLHGGNVDAFGNMVDTLPSSLGYFQESDGSLTKERLAAMEIHRFFWGARVLDITGLNGIGWWLTERIASAQDRDQERSTYALKGFIEGYITSDPVESSKILEESERLLDENHDWTTANSDFLARKFYELNPPSIPTP